MRLLAQSFFSSEIEPWHSILAGASRYYIRYDADHRHSSIVVDYLTRIHGSDEVRVAYIYCDYKDQSVQTASNLIAALARQLVEHPEKLPTQLENMYTELEQHRRRPSLSDLRQLLTALCNERD